MMGWTRFVVALLALGAATTAAADPGLPLVTITPGAGGGQTYSASVQILLMMTVLSLLPAALITMTSFTRIVVVLAILRQALGTGQTPSNQILVGLALFTSLFIMTPVFEKAYEAGVKPYMAEQASFVEAWPRTVAPLREFMFNQTREADLALFANLSGHGDFASRDQVPLTLLLPAFVISELKTAFQIGFLIFIPFLVIDLVVASVLMSLGMMMLSPVMISLPLKIMLFVLVDGWALTIGTLAGSFYA